MDNNCVLNIWSRFGINEGNYEETDLMTITIGNFTFFLKLNEILEIKGITLLKGKKIILYSGKQGIAVVAKISGFTI